MKYINNPVTKTRYVIKEKSSKCGNREVKGLWDDDGKKGELV